MTVSNNPGWQKGVFNSSSGRFPTCLYCPSLTPRASLRFQFTNQQQMKITKNSTVDTETKNPTLNFKSVSLDFLCPMQSSLIYTPHIFF